ncbi:MAG: bifunctional UDP-N-acetylglucosamine diphosphorylase/glucosamine-1-phosphate N-acetyltransferase GlmU, partial [Alphaproteobacteria bacterium]|nr:bifunctional UDP-N-acetylglucosamine diphosphorylase/glucosamine-1-phosphate N-acetyltransferase GlmU [Alphaproteobacteria bacterium]
MRELACIILAAGQGTRMHSSLPKVLHEVAGLSMLGHVLAAAKQLGAMQNIVVASPANAEALKQAVGDVTIAIQDQQLGTGHAVMAGSTTLNNKQADRLILYGDTPLLTLETLQKMVDAQKQHNAAVVVAGFRYVGPTAYGRIVCDAQGFGKKIVEYIDATEEERANNLCNGGLMLLAGDVADALLSKIQKNKRKHEYYLTDIVALATEMGRKTAVVECDEEEVLGVNNRLELSEAEALMQRRLRRQAMLAGVTMQDPGSTFLSYDTHFAPDVVLGPHVVFRPGVRVAGGVL